MTGQEPASPDHFEVRAIQPGSLETSPGSTSNLLGSNPEGSRSPIEADASDVIPEHPGDMRDHISNHLGAPRMSENSHQNSENSDGITNEDHLVFYTTTQVANMLQVTGATVRSMIDRGDLGALRVGGQWRIRRSDLIRFATNKYPDTDQITERPS